ncbi:MAG TPA: IS701 family transposase [Burkholderiaceae bacterium]|nr:IS701 family transposase [Burkholderiaceae bacterium]
MTEQQIRALGPALAAYLDEFADCFVSPDTRRHLKEYVRGQLSNLPRKSVEPIAHLADVPPRTLQEFLSLSAWDADRLRDTVQRVVARDHADAQAIAIVDESGHPKKGSKTACVQRQYCGASGKVDNCVMSVHLCHASFDGAFRAMLDSDLYLPQSWADDEERRHEAKVPGAVEYRPKHEIALGQLRHAVVDNGMHFGWVTADEWYGAKPAFVEGLEALGQRFVLEIPRNLMGWLREPADAGVPRGEVQNLARWSTPMLRQPWVDFHVKDTGMGAMVWEARAAPFWMKRGRSGVVGPYWLVVARDRLDQDEVKYFLSNAGAGVPLEAIVHVAFGRWPVERCIEDEKSELGLGHFECRGYGAVLRHLRVTQVSHLFLARQAARLRGEKPGGDGLPGARRGRRAARRADAGQRRRPGATAGQGVADHPRDAAAQRGRPRVAREGASAGVAGHGHPRRGAALLHPAARA